MKETRSNRPPRIITIAVQLPDQTDEETAFSLEELEDLVKTLGGEVVGSLVQKRERAERTMYLGKGKIAELAQLVRQKEADEVIADDELTAFQLRRLEEGIGDGVTVSDRSSLILGIFSSHATSREGKLQVELAGLQYRLVRLTGGYSDLSRQRGGIGTKGPGEMKIETDRRVLKIKIQKLQEELDKVVQDRDTQRKKRTESFSPLFSLVGYTNAGKSTLLNALSGSRVKVHDGLFTTLDPTARKVVLRSGRHGIVSDTVGFIRKLPHHLVKAFRATLENVVHSQVAVIVTDVSCPYVRERLEAVDEVLRQLQVPGQERIWVFNKCDRPVPHNREALSREFPGAVFISARTGENLEQLKGVMDEVVKRNFLRVTLEMPGNHPLVKDIFALGRVEKQEWEEGLLRMDVELPNAFLPRVTQFRR